MSKLLGWLKSLFTKTPAPPPRAPVTVPAHKHDFKNPDWEWLAANVKLDPGAEKLLDPICDKILAARDRYLQPLQLLTGVPWEFTGALFYREASLNFSKTLHNGEPWNKVTTLVPKGRGPFTSWLDAAVDAYQIKGWVSTKVHLNEPAPIWTFAKCLQNGEKFNGTGYRKYGEYSSYVFGWTNMSDETGRFIADHVYDPDSPDRRPGIAAIMLRIKQRGNK